MKPVFFSNKAEEDLEEIADYIAQDSPTRALSFISVLRQQCEKLSLYPTSFRRYPELGPDAHIMPHKNYVILYLNLDDYVSIERILHGARDILALLED